MAYKRVVKLECGHWAGEGIKLRDALVESSMTLMCQADPTHGRQKAVGPVKKSRGSKKQWSLDHFMNGLPAPRVHWRRHPSGLVVGTHITHDGRTSYEWYCGYCDGNNPPREMKGYAKTDAKLLDAWAEHAAMSRHAAEASTRKAVDAVVDSL